jgi:hypothetical protein
MHRVIKFRLRQKKTAKECRELQEEGHADKKTPKLRGVRGTE